MKVAFFTHYTSLYGANRSMLDLIYGLIPLGVEPLVVVPEEGDIVKVLQEKNIPVLVVPMVWWFEREYNQRRNIFHVLLRRWYSFRRLIKNLRHLPHTADQLKKWGIDLVYSNSSVLPFGAMVARYINKPHVWHLREFGWLDYGLVADWGMPLFNFVVSKSSAQIAISESIHKYYRSAMPPDRGHVMYDGVVPLAKFDSLLKATESCKDDSGEFTFALVGLLRPSKGQDVAIRALDLVRRTHLKARLVLSGDGDIEPLKRLVSKLRLEDRVHFSGFVEDPYPVYLQADAVLMCSVNEGMGRVTIEAMAACRPVIGNDNAGTAELIEHGKTGLLYAGTPEALAECMRRLIDDPALGQCLAESGWKMAREKFSTEQYALRVYEVFKGAIRANLSDKRTNCHD